MFKRNDALKQFLKSVNAEFEDLLNYEKGKKEDAKRKSGEKYQDDDLSFWDLYLKFINDFNSNMERFKDYLNEHLKKYVDGVEKFTIADDETPLDVDALLFGDDEPEDVVEVVDGDDDEPEFIDPDDVETGDDEPADEPLCKEKRSIADDIMTFFDDDHTVGIDYVVDAVVDKLKSHKDVVRKCHGCYTMTIDDPKIIEYVHRNNSIALLHRLRQETGFSVVSVNGLMTPEHGCVEFEFSK